MRRVRSLDGLRGVAALAVVVHHTLLTWTPWLRSTTSRSVPLAPVHAIFDGGIAVYTFFVLSGFVLTWQLGTAGWPAYYAKRVPRLYLPVLGSIAFAALCAVAVRRHVQGDNWWMNAHVGALNAHTVAHEAVMAPGTTWLNSPLWSLTWEMAFSLALPLYVIGAGWLRRAWLAQIVVLLVLAGVGYRTGHDALAYLPMFGIGVVLARHRDRVGNPRGWLGAVLALAAASVIHLVTQRDALALAFAAEAAAAAWLVVAAWRWAGLREQLETRPVQWLGSRSFALYLVHDPVVVSVGQWHAAFALRAPIDLALSLLAAEAFFRIVERPAHRFARHLGRVAEGVRVHPVLSMRGRWHARKAWCPACGQPAGPDGFCSDRCADEWLDATSV